MTIRSMLGGKYQIIHEGMSEILPWLYLGKVDTAFNEEFMITHKFTHIINATCDVSNVTLTLGYGLCTMMTELLICFSPCSILVL